ncbi:hypothetical protein Dda_0243 [Drechslerella dactyloides]|uniref:Uncharacterized protein n=1 Tax=Drechslerella dactyloides TaxID=74499 RepID=A0AAD6NLR9_DREDA|nr:hypothetical protein Dda_0243 [Drechslerella dactyloides]
MTTLPRLALLWKTPIFPGGMHMATWDLLKMSDTDASRTDIGQYADYPQQRDVSDIIWRQHQADELVLVSVEGCRVEKMGMSL